MPTITHLSIQDLNIALTTPFGIAGGAQEIAQNLLVTLELSDGTCGYGEAAPFAAFNGETQSLARAAVLEARSALEGADVRYWRQLARMLGDVHGMIGSARCALETAMLDALTRSVGMPLWSFFGGMGTTLETDMTVVTGTVSEAVHATRGILARGMRTIKIKVGSGDLLLDLERVRAIRAEAPAARLLLDGNGGMSADQSLELLARLREHGIAPALIEQPVPREDLSGMARLAQAGYGPVAADESAASAADVLELIRHNAAQVVNIKLMKCGIVEALDIAALARAAGLGLMIGGMVETHLAMSMSACFAAGQGGFDFVDLDTPLFLEANPFSGGMRYTGARIDLDAIAAGHGATPVGPG